VSGPGGRAAIAVAAGLLFVTACAALSSSTVEHKPDGTYELRCKSALSACLQRADDVCQGAGYTVVRASDDRDYRGPQGIAESEIRSSNALIRCGLRGGPPLFNTSSPPAPPPPPPQPPPVAPPTLRAAPDAGVASPAPPSRDAAGDSGSLGK
jgi:hypothetical protein